MTSPLSYPGRETSDTEPDPGEKGSPRVAHEVVLQQPELPWGRDSGAGG